MCYPNVVTRIFVSDRAVGQDDDVKFLRESEPQLGIQTDIVVPGEPVGGIQ